MQCHRIEELLELLQPAWIKEQDLSLVQFVAKLAQEAGFEGPLSELTDDMLIYHLKMRESDKQAMIPGLAKDHVPDFKEALLKARYTALDSQMSRLNALNAYIGQQVTAWNNQKG